MSASVLDHPTDTRSERWASTPIASSTGDGSSASDEQALPATYLKRLQALYDEWFARYDLSETLVIETDKMDYLQDLVDRLDLFSRIEAAL